MVDIHIIHPLDPHELRGSSLDRLIVSFSQSLFFFELEFSNLRHVDTAGLLSLQKKY